MECKDLRRALAASVLVTLLVPGLAAAALIDAIEYYHAGLDHYFVTTNPTEIANLDNGVLTGWQRTGERFSVGDAATALPGGTPVCRFYGLPQFGLDSHFYSGSPSECAAVAQKFAGVWQLESSNVFQVYLPDPSTGACPADSVPVYRSWNGRADSNHRYTTSAAIQQAMVAKGYVAEGYGPASMPVAMCSPTIAGPVPTCTASASNANPLVGTSITVSASCSPAATSFVWTGCSSSSSSCTASSSAAGVVTYTVVGRNANGSSSPVSVSVAWTTPPPPPSAPTCALAVTTQTDPPTVGSTALISSGCSGVPSSYTWTNCSSGGPNCYVSETVAGPHTYTVVARNAGGASAPVSVTLDWQAGQPVAPDFCGSYPSILRSSIPWTPQRNAIVNSTSYL